jgi:hypothetical protein
VTPEDHVAFSLLANRYAQTLDSGDGPGFAACFTTGGVLDAGERTAGADTLGEWCARRGGGGRHLPTGFAGEVDGDTATLTSYGLFHDGKPQPAVLSLVYQDRLEREAGTWRFAERRVTEIGGLPQPS